MTIALASKYQPILDEIYKNASLTASMDAATKPVNFGGANAVNVFKTSMVGLGDYSRSTGYPVGDVAGAWETLTLSKERGRAFSIDRMDDEETLGMAFGTLAGEFIRTQVAPELDAYRFSTYASTTGIQEVAAGAALDTGAKVLAAFDVAMGKLDEKEVPAEGRKLFLSSGCYNLLKGQLTRTLSTETSADRRVFEIDGVEVIPVPQTRFYKGITLVDGSSAATGGYSKTENTGKNINFLLLHPSSVLQVTKLSDLKVFAPEDNQTADAWLIQYRIYHDAFVYANKKEGIYSHIATS
ncbi:MAG TPA: hypothetical protein PLG04_08115 [Anaerolineaceae bacterium]|nr:hypothetical protein [Anaerolineaceae bacterium]